MTYRISVTPCCVAFVFLLGLLSSVMSTHAATITFERLPDNSVPVDNCTSAGLRLSGRSDGLVSVSILITTISPTMRRSLSSMTIMTMTRINSAGVTPTQAIRNADVDASPVERVSTSLSEKEKCNADVTSR